MRGRKATDRGAVREQKPEPRDRKQAAEGPAEEVCERGAADTQQQWQWQSNSSSYGSTGQWTRKLGPRRCHGNEE